METGEALSEGDAETVKTKPAPKTVEDELVEEDSATLAATENTADEVTSDRDISTEDEKNEDVETPEEAEALINEEAESRNEEGIEKAA